MTEHDVLNNIHGDWKLPPLEEEIYESYKEAAEDGSEKVIDDWRKHWLKQSDKFDFFVDEFLFDKDPDVRMCYALLKQK